MGHTLGLASEVAHDVGLAGAKRGRSVLVHKDDLASWKTTDDARPKGLDYPALGRPKPGWVYGEEGCPVRWLSEDQGQRLQPLHVELLIALSVGAGCS
jgi:hypothetical protein